MPDSGGGEVVRRQGRAKARVHVRAKGIGRGRLHVHVQGVARDQGGQNGGQAGLGRLQRG
jgi:hypothetical protein